MVCELTAHALGTTGAGAAVAVALATVETHPRATIALTIHTNLRIPASLPLCTPQRAGGYSSVAPNRVSTQPSSTTPTHGVTHATLAQTGQPERSRSRRRWCFPWAGPNSAGSGRSP